MKKPTNTSASAGFQKTESIISEANKTIRTILLSVPIILILLTVAVAGGGSHV
jgi:hypothetical protein